jgi:hypothetical protein
MLEKEEKEAKEKMLKVKGQKLKKQNQNQSMFRKCEVQSKLRRGS